jgi:hypothetical protein
MNAMEKGNKGTQHKEQDPQKGAFIIVASCSYYSFRKNPEKGFLGGHGKLE